MKARPSVINHHLKILLCDPAYRGTGVWDCTEGGAEVAGSLPQAPACLPNQYNELYSWIPGGGNLNFPESVGQELEGNPKGEVTMLLEVHYAHIPEHPEHAAISDGTEGVVIRFAPRSAGVVSHRSGSITFEAKGLIPKHSILDVEVSCRVDDDIVMHPFSYQVHTHKLGTRVSAWKVDQDDVWSLIGSADPVLQIAVYPVRDLVIRKGDMITVRCSYNNTLDRDVILR